VTSQHHLSGSGAGQLGLPACWTRTAGVEVRCVRYPPICAHGRARSHGGAGGWPRAPARRRRLGNPAGYSKQPTYEAFRRSGALHRSRQLARATLPGEWPTCRGGDALVATSILMEGCRGDSATRSPGLSAEEVQCRGCRLARVSAADPGGGSRVYSRHLEKCLEAYLSLAPGDPRLPSPTTSSFDSYLEFWWPQVEPDHAQLCRSTWGRPASPRRLSDVPPRRSRRSFSSTRMSPAHIVRTSPSTGLVTTLARTRRGNSPAHPPPRWPTYGTHDPAPASEALRQISFDWPPNDSHSDDRQDAGPAPALARVRRGVGRLTVGAARARGDFAGHDAPRDPGELLRDTGRIRGGSRCRHRAVFPCDVAIAGGFPVWRPVSRAGWPAHPAAAARDHMPAILYPAGVSWFGEASPNSLHSRPGSSSSQRRHGDSRGA